MPEQFEHLDPKSFDEAVVFENGLPYIRWKAISQHIRSKRSEPEWSDAWRESVGRWLGKLAASLGAPYAVNESPHFFVMSGRNEEGRQKLALLTERMLGQMRRTLSGIQVGKTYGKHVILLFVEQDEYYRYVAHFHREGAQILSAGMFLQSGGYAHIALHESRFGIAQTLSHELAHNCLMTLPLPLWLNEGMAHLLERGDSFDRTQLDADLACRHFDFWNTENIQEFWNGHAFGDPSTSELAYSLARVLITVIRQEKWDLAGFVQQAHYVDAGDKAAKERLGKTLGELAGVFLGPGNWMPITQTA